MVDQSELPFRMLCRNFGAQLCFTPMLHSGMFLKDKNYRAKNFTTVPKDRPLIVQFCANDPVILLEAARLVEDRCDGVDINLGCPQSIAKKGNYGAFLQDNWELIGELISILHDNLKIPVTCKIRIFPEITRTIEYALFLQSKGVSILTVHGRTRDQKGVLTGSASWEHILAVKQAVSIPVFANGNILCLDDVKNCLLLTKSDGVMSAEGLLYNPALFTDTTPCVYEVARGYLEMVVQYPVHTSAIRGHLFKIFHDVLQNYRFEKFRQQIGTASDFKCLMDIVGNIGVEMDNFGSKFVCRPYLHHATKNEPQKSVVSTENVCELVYKKSDGLSSKKDRKHFQENSNSNCKKSRLELYSFCSECGCNPLSAKCDHKCCKKCCKQKCRNLLLICSGHNFKSNNIQ
ncbi:tRNA-dihydrouridine(16/17) synthase -like [Oopsacas minuta]|uniref:tRNA-dihydrouridine(16/17) synthase [NAD(P)(+)] n=1 Tax=Oopsacas minuta TaxID=111878 RepID=A0AAV7J9U0_9METZ|nr:tRNA-dihydrouridine(16/17) synthase -like [Oopsacas minuta]